MSRWASNTTCLHLKGSKTAQKGAKRACHGALGPRHVALDLQRDVALAQRVQNCLKEGEKSATSYWAPAMSRWASNTTWLRLQGAKTAQKGARRACHVVLGPRHVALNLQHDVAPAQRRQNSPKGSKKSAPRRIGPPPCRVGPLTRRGSPTSDSIVL